MLIYLRLCLGLTLESVLKDHHWQGSGMAPSIKSGLTSCKASKRTPIHCTIDPAHG